MPLIAHQTPRMVIPLLDGNDVAVRGFNLDDFAALMPDHFEAISKIAALYAEQKSSVFSSKAIGDFIMASASAFPNLVSEVISIAADEPDAKHVKLGTSLQISVLSAIVKLTVEEAGGLGNLFGQLRALGERLVAVRAEMADPKRFPFNGSTGTGESMSAS
jgi:hypothetical protein